MLRKAVPSWKFSSAELPSLLFEALDKIGERRHVLAVPPDPTRRDSRAGELTQHAYDYYGGRLEAVLPALSTHIAMSSVQLTSMFGKMPHELFRIHNTASRRRDQYRNSGGSGIGDETSAKAGDVVELGIEGLGQSRQQGQFLGTPLFENGLNSELKLTSLSSHVLELQHACKTFCSSIPGITSSSLSLI